MTFCDALVLLRAGLSLRRAVWGPDVSIRLILPSSGSDITTGTIVMVEGNVIWAHALPWIEVSADDWEEVPR